MQERGVQRDRSTASTSSDRVERGPRFGSAMGIVGFVAALGGGFFIGQQLQLRDQADWSGFEDRARYRVELQGHEPQKGPDDALVTIIEFSDYECPFCQRAHEPLLEAVDDHEDVRLIVKHMPLPMHARAIPAARAAWAAHQQGQFWPMHEHLFGTQGNLEGLESVAEDMGLDVERFNRDMLSESAGDALEADRYAAGRLGIGSTPHFVVNGRHIRGALAPNHWDAVIDAERDDALELVAQGVPRASVYDAIMRDATATRARKPPEGPDPQRRYMVEPGDGRPSLGPADAPITIVEFFDYACPYCARLAPILREQVDRHSDVRWVVRQLPLPNHPMARPAAYASLAAQRQGRFWEMHDALYALGSAMTAEDIDQIARNLGLDFARFTADRQDPAIEAMVAEDMAVARRLGIRGTPSTLINGRLIGGVQSSEALQAAIGRERVAVQEVLDRGTPPTEVMAELRRRDNENVGDHGE